MPPPKRYLAVWGTSEVDVTRGINSDGSNADTCC